MDDPKFGSQTEVLSVVDKRRRRDDELVDLHAASEGKRKKEAEGGDFVGMILDNLRNAGVQQAHKVDRLPEIHARAGLPDSYKTELRKGIKLAKYVRPIA